MRASPPRSITSWLARSALGSPRPWPPQTKMPLSDRRCDAPQDRTRLARTLSNRVCANRFASFGLHDASTYPTGQWRTRPRVRAECLYCRHSASSICVALGPTWSAQPSNSLPPSCLHTRIATGPCGLIIYKIELSRRPAVSGARGRRAATCSCAFPRHGQACLAWVWLCLSRSLSYVCSLARTDPVGARSAVGARLFVITYVHDMNACHPPRTRRMMLAL
jgi:hypothetical protein